MSASRIVEAHIETIFSFLSERQNHQRLTSRKLQLLTLSDRGGDDWQAVMQLRTPLGLTRRATAETETSEQPTLIEGSVRLGPRTDVRIRWELYRVARDQTEVVLGASVRSLGALDWILLHVGGRRWVRNLFTTTLELLADELEPSHVVELALRRPPAPRPAT